MGASAGGVAGRQARSAMCLPELWLVDVHSHVWRSADDFAELLAIMDRHRIQAMGVSALVWHDADQLVAGAGFAEPDRFFPFLRGFDLERNTSIDYVRNRLATGRFKGIGELFINGHGHRTPGDHPVLMEIYRLAGEYRVPVLLHWTIGSRAEREAGTREGFQALKRVLAAHPATTFILAHLGRGPAPHRENHFAVLEHLLHRYRNLRLDLAGLHRDLYDGEGRLTPFASALLDLIKRFPRRFLLGLDLGEPGSLAREADATVAAWRRFLVYLPSEVAAAVGRTNALQIFGACRHPDLERVRPPLRIRGEKGFLPLDYPVPD
ncbi:MAG: putative 5-oxo-L-prolinase [Candidatus Ozemobacter sibiricus]|uniref:Putative 5-oxo-L-prolinase n=1 Tax=Candidatus Ozemobacter sibiricus TaxID=2268124 RepID=A0A367ZMR8_9BACT|nr:MAG: putative 5-oxo-L-prolinase [Candidatus Ozemobacter sibiricus]